MADHRFQFQTSQMCRSNALFIFQIAFVFLLLAIFYTIPAAAQQPAQQQRTSTQPLDPDDEEMINPDRPGIADGSAVIGAKRLQVETGFQEEFRRREQTRQHTFFFPTLLRIGISNHWEAHIEGNTFTRKRDSDSTGMTDHISGLAPLSFGIKYHIQDSRGVEHPSLGAIVRIFPAWGTTDFRTHHVTGDLRLAADWDFAPQLKLSLNPNVGVGVNEDDQGKAFAAGLLAATLNYSPSKRLNPFIDLGLQAPEENKGKTALIVDVGVAYILRRNIQFDASIGTGGHGQTPLHPFVSFGISFRSNGLRHRK